MDTNSSRCAITGYTIVGKMNNDGQTIEYQSDCTGKVRITQSAFTELWDGDFERYLIGGICRHRTIFGKEPLLINSDFISDGYKRENPPTTFEEKLIYLNKAIYQMYDKVGENGDLQSFRDCTLGYADNKEFDRLIERLKDLGYINYKERMTVGRIEIGNNIYLYRIIKMTEKGRTEAQKTMPHMPMTGLVSHEITTGDQDIDSQINHAKNLFFKSPQTFDDMRSACEALSFVLEPLRKELKSVLASKDVSDFFEIVNNFDIRHNKESTKQILHPEQLEWVFYTLLNSINVYYKMINKHSPK